MGTHGDILNVPFQLRGNDSQRHIINIDSRFRDSVVHTTASNFHVTLPSPIRNILRIRITSFEFPNNYYMFTSKRSNTTFRIIHMNGEGVTIGEIVTIPDGTYTACEMESTLNAIFSTSGSELQWLSVKFDPITGHFIFTGKKRFGVDTLYGGYDRPFDYGLGYYLGFTQDLHKSEQQGTVWRTESDCQANFAGDSYIFLRLNDYKCVNHNVEGSSINAFAKFILKEQKNNMTFDDYAGQHIKEIVFTAPQDVTRLRIQVLDAYGDVLDIGCNNFSFSIEILEIKNASLYQTVRNSLQTIYN